MAKNSLYILILAICCLLSTISCAQDNSSLPNATELIFVGSTPCDSLIKSELKIPGSSKCDFIKWELKLGGNKDSSNQYHLTAVYGEAKPNTNGFMNGGNKLSVTGKLSISHGSKANPGSKVYYLNSDSFAAPIVLIEMDNNILHFADTNKNLLLGNGGWGYVLNRLK
jgi:hypothetical protein